MYVCMHVVGEWSFRHFSHMRYILEHDKLQIVGSWKVQVHGLQSQPGLNGKTGPLDAVLLRKEPLEGFSFLKIWRFKTNLVSVVI